MRPAYHCSMAGEAPAEEGPASPDAEPVGGQVGETPSSERAAAERRRMLVIALFVGLSMLVAFVLAYWYGMPSAG
jgi:hypothetical protein